MLQYHKKGLKLDTQGQLDLTRTLSTLYTKVLHRINVRTSFGRHGSSNYKETCLDRCGKLKIPQPQIIGVTSVTCDRVINCRGQQGDEKKNIQQRNLSKTHTKIEERAGDSRERGPNQLFLRTGTWNAHEISNERGWSARRSKNQVADFVMRCGCCIFAP